MKCTISSCTQQVNVLRLTVGSIAVVALIFSASIDFLVPLFRESPLIASDYHAELIIKALHSNTVVSFFPIVAALPMAGSYLDDIKNKFALCILIRTDCMKYLISRILVCYLSGGGCCYYRDSTRVERGSVTAFSHGKNCRSFFWFFRYPPKNDRIDIFG